jgi:hypothetical protein
MVSLPPERTPLYNHPLPALEAWLRQLGARQDPSSASAWERPSSVQGSRAVAIAA